MLQSFWNGNYLADGLYNASRDETIRPNVFIAAYVYPSLLNNANWTKCFSYLLPKLWLDFGGLSTIDKSHHLFCNEYTGENNQSYHRGDSWYWLNNLSALVMHRIDKNKFSVYVNKIL